MEARSLRRLGLVLVVALLAAAAAPLDALYRKLELLAEVIGHIQTRHVEPPDPEKLMYGAIRGAVSALDAHSTFFAPEQFRSLLEESSGSFVGVGVELASMDGTHRIVSVYAGSPAARAGVLLDDEIVAIDGRATSVLQHDEVKALLAGERHTKVVLSLYRQSRADVWNFTLERDEVYVPHAMAKRLGSGLLYIQLTAFTDGSGAEVRRSLKELARPLGIVLDLRGNLGGLFDEALDVADLFLRAGVIVQVAGRAGAQSERHLAFDDGDEPKCRIAVLIDGRTASAAELVAAALQEQGGARLFGQTSFGKGSVQSLVPLSDGSGLKLTVARYVTPNARPIDKVGVVPDVALPAEVDAMAEAVAWLTRR